MIGNNHCVDENNSNKSEKPEDPDNLPDSDGLIVVDLNAEENNDVIPNHTDATKPKSQLRRICCTFALILTLATMSFGFAVMTQYSGKSSIQGVYPDSLEAQALSKHRNRAVEVSVEQKAPDSDNENTSLHCEETKSLHECCDVFMSTNYSDTIHWCLTDLVLEYVLTKTTDDPNNDATIMNDHLRSIEKIFHGAEKYDRPSDGGMFISELYRTLKNITWTVLGNNSRRKRHIYSDYNGYDYYQDYQDLMFHHIDDNQPSELQNVEYYYNPPGGEYDDVENLYDMHSINQKSYPGHSSHYPSQVDNYNYRQPGRQLDFETNWKSARESDVVDTHSRNDMLTPEKRPSSLRSADKNIEQPTEVYISNKKRVNKFDQQEHIDASSITHNPITKLKFSSKNEQAVGEYNVREKERSKITAEMRDAEINADHALSRSHSSWGDNFDPTHRTVPSDLTPKTDGGDVSTASKFFINRNENSATQQRAESTKMDFDKTSVLNTPTKNAKHPISSEATAETPIVYQNEFTDILVSNQRNSEDVEGNIHSEAPIQDSLSELDSSTINYMNLGQLNGLSQTVVPSIVGRNKSTSLVLPDSENKGSEHGGSHVPTKTVGNQGTQKNKPLIHYPLSESDTSTTSHINVGQLDALSDPEIPSIIRRNKTTSVMLPVSESRNSVDLESHMHPESVEGIRTQESRASKHHPLAESDASTTSHITFGQLDDLSNPLIPSVIGRNKSTSVILPVSMNRNSEDMESYMHPESVESTGIQERRASKHHPLAESDASTTSHITVGHLDGLSNPLIPSVIGRNKTTSVILPVSMNRNSEELESHMNPEPVESTGIQERRASKHHPLAESDASTTSHITVGQLDGLSNPLIPNIIGRNKTNSVILPVSKSRNSADLESHMHPVSVKGTGTQESRASMHHPLAESDASTASHITVGQLDGLSNPLIPSVIGRNKSTSVILPVSKSRNSADLESHMHPESVQGTGTQESRASKHHPLAESDASTTSNITVGQLDGLSNPLIPSIIGRNKTTSVILPVAMNRNSEDLESHMHPESVEGTGTQESRASKHHPLAESDASTTSHITVGQLDGLSNPLIPNIIGRNKTTSVILPVSKSRNSADLESHMHPESVEGTGTQESRASKHHPLAESDASTTSNITVGQLDGLSNPLIPSIIGRNKTTSVILPVAMNRNSEDLESHMHPESVEGTGTQESRASKHHPLAESDASTTSHITVGQLDGLSNPLIPNIIGRNKTNSVILPVSKSRNSADLESHMHPESVKGTGTQESRASMHHPLAESNASTTSHITVGQLDGLSNPLIPSVIGRNKSTSVILPVSKSRNSADLESHMHPESVESTGTQERRASKHHPLAESDASTTSNITVGQLDGLSNPLIPSIIGRNKTTSVILPVSMNRNSADPESHMHPESVEGTQESRASKHHPLAESDASTISHITVGQLDGLSNPLIPNIIGRNKTTSVILPVSKSRNSADLESHMHPESVESTGTQERRASKHHPLAESDASTTSNITVGQLDGLSNPLIPSIIGRNKTTSVILPVSMNRNSEDLESHMHPESVESTGTQEGRASKHHPLAESDASTTSHITVGQLDGLSNPLIPNIIGRNKTNSVILPVSKSRNSADLESHMHPESVKGTGTQESRASMHHPLAESNASTTSHIPVGQLDGLSNPLIPNIIGRNKTNSVILPVSKSRNSADLESHMHPESVKGTGTQESRASMHHPLAESDASTTSHITVGQLDGLSNPLIPSVIGRNKSTSVILPVSKSRNSADLESHMHPESVESTGTQERRASKHHPLAESDASTTSNITVGQLDGLSNPLIPSIIGRNKTTSVILPVSMNRNSEDLESHMHSESVEGTGAQESRASKHHPLAESDASTTSHITVGQLDGLSNPLIPNIIGRNKTTSVILPVSKSRNSADLESHMHPESLESTGTQESRASMHHPLAESDASTTSHITVGQLDGLSNPLIPSVIGRNKSTSVILPVSKSRNSADLESHMHPESVESTGTQEWRASKHHPLAESDASTTSNITVGQLDGLSNPLIPSIIGRNKTTSVILPVSMNRNSEDLESHMHSESVEGTGAQESRASKHHPLAESDASTTSHITVGQLDGLSNPLIPNIIGRNKTTSVILPVSKSRNSADLESHMHPESLESTGTQESRASMHHPLAESDASTTSHITVGQLDGLSNPLTPSVIGRNKSTSVILPVSKSRNSADLESHMHPEPRIVKPDSHKTVDGDDKQSVNWQESIDSNTTSQTKDSFQSGKTGSHTIPDVVKSAVNKGLRIAKVKGTGELVGLSARTLRAKNGFHHSTDRDGDYGGMEADLHRSSNNQVSEPAFRVNVSQTNPAYGCSGQYGCDNANNQSASPLRSQNNANVRANNDFRPKNTPVFNVDLQTTSNQNTAMNPCFYPSSPPFGVPYGVMGGNDARLLNVMPMAAPTNPQSPALYLINPPVYSFVPPPNRFVSATQNYQLGSSQRMNPFSVYNNVNPPSANPIQVSGPGGQYYMCSPIPAPNNNIVSLPGVEIRSALDAAMQEFLEGASHNNSTQGREAVECPLGFRSCADGSRCIKEHQICDNEVQCGDVSDEMFCSCKQRVGALRLCDGFHDCPNGEDELECFGCGENEFSCDDWSKFRSGTCIPIDQRCDGIRHCEVTGRDEEGCTVLRDHLVNNRNYQVSFAVGYLHRNYKGVWYPTCLGTDIWALDVCRLEAGPSEVIPRTHMMLTLDNYDGKYLSLLPNNEVSVISSCVQDRAAYVECPPLYCGMRMITINPYRPSELDTSMEEAINGMKTSILKEISQKPLARGGTNDTMEENLADSNENMRRDAVVGNSRVVGGKASQPGAWPWVVSVYKNGIFHCGGVLINELWIVTAAHCLDRYWQYYYEIEAGILRRFSYSPMQQTRFAVEAIQHRRYDKKELANDIALMKLSAPVRYNRYVRPICLPSEATAGPDFLDGPRPGTVCTTVGWGSMVEHGTDPDHMREVEIPIMTRCKHSEDIVGRELCAGLLEGGKDACQGDSGGPLMCRNPTNPSQWYLAGIVSHGEGCARPEEPGVYTKVSLYLSWIAEILRADTNAIRLPLQRCPGYVCKGTRTCLPKKRRCDKIVDCLMGDDELNCARTFHDILKEADMILGSARHITENMQDLTVNNTSINRTRDSASITQVASKETDISLNDTDYLETIVGLTDVSPVQYFKCGRMLQIIPSEKRCNKVIDCEDGSDEMNCLCVDYIRSLYPEAICDGITDCIDMSDEFNCSTCNATQYYCRLSKQCIDGAKRCDRKVDCLQEEDELDCVALTDGSALTLDSDLRPRLSMSGIITINRAGVWRPLCTNVSDNHATAATNVCNLLGFEEYTGFYKFPVEDKPVSVKMPGSKRPAVSTDAPDNMCNGLYVRCSNVSLDSHVHKVYRSNITANMDVDVDVELYTLPWNAVIYSDGEYKCMGAILDTRWIVTSLSCFPGILMLKFHYITVILGKGKSNSGVHGPHEQVYSVLKSIRVPNTNIVLLYLDRGISFTRYVKPTNVNPKLGKPHIQKCILAGIENRRTTFLYLTQQQICTSGYSCFKRGSNIPKSCKNENPWNGVVFCDSRNGWYPSAVFEEQQGLCGFGDHMRYTSIPNNMKQVFKIISDNQSLLDLAHCEGFRCALGNCISHDRICNGVPECWNDEDEGETLCSEKDGACTLTGKCDCKITELKCKTGGCIPKEKFCDGIDDCGDFSDEPDVCSCRSYLSLTNSSKVCDGVLNCEDRTDEDPELCTCKLDDMRCGQSEFCVSSELICDGYEDCPGGEDENICYSLNETNKRATSGEVMQRTAGIWHPGCFPQHMTSNQLREVCRKLGFASENARELSPLDHIVDLTASSPRIDRFDVVWIHRTRAHKLKLRLRTGNEPYVTFKEDPECHRLFIDCT